MIMMPTIQKCSVLLSDENVNPSCKTVATECESTNQMQNVNSKSSLISNNSGSHNARSLSGERSDDRSKDKKIFKDLTNNNIVDCLIKDSSPSKYSAKDSSKDALFNNSNSSIQSNGSVQNSNCTAVKELLDLDFSYRESVAENSGHRDRSKDGLSSELELKDYSRNGSALRDSVQSNNQSRIVDTPIRTIDANSRENQVNCNLSATSSTNVEQRSKHKKFANNKNRDSSSSNCSLGTLVRVDEPFVKDWKYCKTHQKRFKRRFPTIETDEQLIDWFHCALIADILLQGYLYISENYIAFYSNIFGYKTHVLVSVSDVYAITKEKTAKIFPNAVGIHTKSDKFVFGSLLSREKTFELLNEVRSSYLVKEKQTTTDLSEEDELTAVTGTLKLNTAIVTNDSLSSGDNKISIEERDVKADTRSNSLRRHHRRSSSLKLLNGTKDTESDLTMMSCSRRQSKLLNSSSENKLDFNQLLLKLTSLKSILRFEFNSSKSSYLLISIGLLLFLLLVSISILLIQINSAHERLISMSKYSHLMSPNVDLFNEMFHVMEVMKSNLNEISRLRSKPN